MFGLLASTFRRFSAQHVDIAQDGFPILDVDGRRIGHVDEVRLRRSRLHLSGWALADSAELVSLQSRARVPIDNIRADVTQAIGVSESARVGFAVDVPYGHAVSRLIIRDGQRFYIYNVGPFSWHRHRLAMLSTAARFVLTGALLTPSVLRYALGGSGEAQALLKIKRGLGLLGVAASPGVRSLDERVRPGQPAPPSAVPQHRTSIIVPVYNGFDLLPELLRRLREHTDLPYRLILIDDKSTDPRVLPFLRDWAERQPGEVSLIENAQNLGFIGSVNRAFETALGHDGHVVLLNSDAFVPEGWLSRLVAPIHAEERVASVTPMSNDAEIVTAPMICQPVPLEPGQADRIDATARRLPVAGPRELPTGVGFCMAINRDYLEREPRFDTAFGRGYGEEVDWCRKVLRLGGRHLAAPNLFVEHRGGASFGSAAKAELLRRNGRTITERYPEYDLEVQRFIGLDPLFTERLALALAHAAAAAAGPVEIVVAHTIGGGAEKYLEKRIAEGIARGRPSVVLRVGGTLEWTVELWTGQGKVAGQTSDFGFVQALLEPLRERVVVYSCAVGARDPLAIPEAVRALAAGGALEVLFHDYFALSPSYCLLDRDGVYRGVPQPGGADGAHRYEGGGRTVSLAAWREAWGAMLADAGRLVVFSEDSARNVRAAYPHLGDRIVVRPHTLVEPVPAVARRPLSGGRAVIGVLGNIGLQKGALVVSEMSRRIAGRRDVSLALIGNIDLYYRPDPSTPIHGDYEIADIPRLVESYGIDAWLIPSVWPETFSYTLHEALATGLPVFCFDLGAQAEAARAARNGFVLDLALAAAGPPGQPPLEDVILRILKQERHGEDGGSRGTAGRLEERGAVEPHGAA
ncbi:MAG TPA: glycosyltransferase [Thermohalobaculum sp.]|nr:glycosyltransferase [Thermohalobaculum sp.]